MSDLELEPLKRLDRDLASASVTLSIDEVRYLVSGYYAMQDARIADGHRLRTLALSGQPHEVISWLGTQHELLEGQIKRALDKWTASQPLTRWARTIVGIGPVISAGLAAHIDLEPWNCALHRLDRSTVACTAKEPHEGAGCGNRPIPSVGHIWSFAGLNPEVKWNKGEKRPFNADLKTLAVFRMGESFVKVQNRDGDVYGHVYAMRKKLEAERNDSGLFADTAARDIARFGKGTEAYKAYVAGKLPQARIHNRARRYAVKLFLSHYYMVAFFVRYGVLPPFPYVFEHLPGHVHFISPPNAEEIEGLPAALREYEVKLLASRTAGLPAPKNA